MTNKIILITGATDGIGKQTAIELAKKNSTLLLHGRNADSLGKIKEEIFHLSGNNKLDFFVADLSSLTQVRSAAAEIKSKYDRLDVLINNAGVYMKSCKLTEDGFETTFAVNHLAHFLLTNLLLELLQQSESSRIINVSSVAHTRARLDFDNLNGEKFFEAYNAYAVSKLVNVLFSYKLAGQLDNTNVSVNALHPGAIGTKLLRAGFGIGGGSVKDGAATSVYLASSHEVENVTGKYFVRMKDTPSSDFSYDTELQDKLWDISREMTGLNKR